VQNVALGEFVLGRIVCDTIVSQWREQIAKDNNNRYKKYYCGTDNIIFTRNENDLK
jgi:hypothetical protein